MRAPWPSARRRSFFQAALTAGCFLSLSPSPWLGLPATVECAEARPAESQKPSLRVVVDPRVELMSIIFRLAGNPEYGKGRVPAYVDDVEKRFAPWRDHPAVKLARDLRRTRGVSYDAVMSMAVHVTDAYALEEKVPFEPRPPGLDQRWPIPQARRFLEAARDFVKETSFRDFVDEHRALYELTESRMHTVLERHAHLEWFGEFFGERPKASFTVALGLLNGGGCYGSRCLTADGREELYCVLGVWLVDGEGKPEFNQGMLGTVTHEFCHSYTNAVVDRHEAQLEPAGKKIFPHVEAAMRRLAYGNWKTMMYESMVRACVIRYTRKYHGAVAAWMAVQQEKARHFSWIKELSDLLGEYEAHRDEYPTLDAFFPRIVAMFNDYADRFAEKQKALAAERPKVVSMTPDNGAADVDPALAAIRVVFDRPMADGSWSMVGGGPHFPEVVGKPSYDETKTVWTVPVKLKPDWSYRFMLNSGRFQAFRSEAGVPLEPVTVEFKTGKQKTEQKKESHPLPRPGSEVTIAPVVGRPPTSVGSSRLCFSITKPSRLCFSVSEYLNKRGARPWQAICHDVDFWQQPARPRPREPWRPRPAPKTANPPGRDRSRSSASAVARAKGCPPPRPCRFRSALPATWIPTGWKSSSSSWAG
jgi:hypothetical protein